MRGRFEGAQFTGVQPVMVFAGRQRGVARDPVGGPSWGGAEPHLQPLDLTGLFHLCNLRLPLQGHDGVFPLSPPHPATSLTTIAPVFSRSEHLLKCLHQQLRRAVHPELGWTVLFLLQRFLPPITCV